MKKNGKEIKEMGSQGLSLINTMAMTIAKKSVNSACSFIHHQPEIPSEMRKFKTISKK